VVSKTPVRLAPITDYRLPATVNYVVHLEWCPGSRKPFGAGCRATLAACVKRKLERLDQSHDFGTGGDMRQAGFRTQRCLIEAVERRQSAGKEFAVDHAFGQALGTAEPEPGRELAQPLPHQALVARTQHRQAIAHHNPVRARAIDDPTLASGIAHHAGIMAL